MLREERLKQILDKLQRDQRVSSTELMEEFQVSEGTIRRDLKELAEQGLLRKVHGGPVFKASQVTVGIEMSDTLQQIRADVCFIGVRSIHHELGLTTLEIEEARIKRKMTEVSDRIIVMATADKLDTVDHFKICDYRDIDVLILEEEAEEDVLNRYRQKGVEVM